MAKVKKARKAQDGKSLKERMESAPLDYYKSINEIGSKGIDTAARRKAIKEGRFKEDPKSGDLIELPKNREPKRIYVEPKKSKSGSKVVKKAKSGAALKKQAAKAIAMKKAGKSPKKAMGGMKMMKGGGKCKYGC